MNEVAFEQTHKLVAWTKPSSGGPAEREEAKLGNPRVRASLLLANKYAELAGEIHTHSLRVTKF